MAWSTSRRDLPGDARAERHALRERFDEPLDEEWSDLDADVDDDAYSEYGDAFASQSFARASAINNLDVDDSHDTRSRAALVPLPSEQPQPPAPTLIQPSKPIIAPGDGRPHSVPFIKRRKRPLLVGLTAVALMCCILFTGFFLNVALPALQGGQGLGGGVNKVWDTAGAVVQLGQGGGAAPGVHAPGSAGLPISKSAPPVTQISAPGAPVLISPPPVYPWPPAYAYMAVPGYPSFTVAGPGSFYPGVFGQCTWWAAYERQDENFSSFGDAMFWAGGALSHGYPVGNIPVPGSTVVFQPGVQGAGGVGHVAHVEKVYTQGWFLISEMNFYGAGTNGGGYGVVDYRLVHTGYGVQFIY